MVQSSNDFLFEAKLIAQREYVKREFNRARKMSFYTLFHSIKRYSMYEKRAFMNSNLNITKLMKRNTL